MGVHVNLFFENFGVGMNQVRSPAKMVEVMCDSRTECQWGKSRRMDGQTDKQVETHNPFHEDS